MKMITIHHLYLLDTLSHHHQLFLWPLHRVIFKLIHMQCILLNLQNFHLAKYHSTISLLPYFQTTNVLAHAALSYETLFSHLLISP